MILPHEITDALRLFSNRNSRTPRRKARQSARHRTPVLEILEDRTLLSISGRSIEDVTADGFSPDDTAISGRTINLYVDDSGNIFDPAIDLLDATQVTDGNGYFEFSGQAVGTYFVDEEMPVDWMPTAGLSFYTISSSRYTR